MLLVPTLFLFQLEVSVRHHLPCHKYNVNEDDEDDNALEPQTYGMLSELLPFVSYLLILSNLSLRYTNKMLLVAMSRDNCLDKDLSHRFVSLPPRASQSWEGSDSIASLLKSSQYRCCIFWFDDWDSKAPVIR